MSTIDRKSPTYVADIAMAVRRFVLVSTSKTDATKVTVEGKLTEMSIRAMPDRWGQGGDRLDVRLMVGDVQIDLADVTGFEVLQ
jgi:hypothetical protein